MPVSIHQSAIKNANRYQEPSPGQVGSCWWWASACWRWRSLFGFLRGDTLQYFFHAYLVSFCFYLSISLGALFFVALQHASRAGWSVAVRRVAEIMAANTLVMAVLFLPILLPLLFGNTTLYHWLDPAVVAEDHVLAGKSAYLNLPFFVVRAVAFFVVWGGLVWYFWRRSLEQDDSGDASLTLRMERVSYPALLLFAVTITFAAFDWIMSLTPHWYSTIFGVYYFAGAVVGFLVGRDSGLDHAAEDGALDLHGHVGALPRTWQTVVRVYRILGIHCFFAVHADLVRQHSRRDGLVLAAAEGAVDHGVADPAVRAPVDSLLWPDVAWSEATSGHARVLGGLVVGGALAGHALSDHAQCPADSAWPLGLIDVCCMVGMGAIFVAGVLLFAGNRSLTPTKDPRLGESLGFENT